MAFVSICIPTYEMGGQGAFFLKESFDILTEQTYKNFEIIISDHSTDEAVKNVCGEYAARLAIRYIRNTEHRGSSSANLNNAIRFAKGTLIKVLFQDDILYNSEALAYTVAAFDLQKDHWLISTYTHTCDGKTFFKPYTPRYNRYIYLGVNTIGTPSGLTILNKDPLLFDESLIWLMDCDYYKHCYDAFGAPTILNTLTVVSRISAHQVTNTLATKSIRKREYEYTVSKFNTKFGRIKKFLYSFIHHIRNEL